MAEIPKLPEAGSSDGTKHQDITLERAAEWLLRHQESLATKREATKSSSLSGTPLSYELDISPDLKARVELEEKTEVDFDRRHEVLDEQALQEPSLNGMVPLGQILSDHLSYHSLQNVGQTPQTAHSENSQLDGQTSISPIYRFAIRSGLVGGTIIAIAIFLLIIK